MQVTQQLVPMTCYVQNTIKNKKKSCKSWMPTNLLLRVLFAEEKDPPGHSSSSEATSCQRNGGLHHRKGCQGKDANAPATSTGASALTAQEPSPSRLPGSHAGHRYWPASAASSTPSCCKSGSSAHACYLGSKSSVLGQKWPIAEKSSGCRQVWCLCVTAATMQ